ncbi:hypothetical protein BGX29_003636 [Mortierella sp. GBA35]|nr:hypothetical protein BGX29_003636 [Mortierella sp. GBA35]
MMKCVRLFNEKQERKATWILCAAHSIQLCINTALGKGKETENSKSASAFFKRCEQDSRLILGARVHKLAAEIVDAVEVVSRSSIKIDADKARTAKNGLLNQQELRGLKDIHDVVPPLDLYTTEPARVLHAALMDQILARFLVDGIPDTTVIAMFPTLAVSISPS